MRCVILVAVLAFAAVLVMSTFVAAAPGLDVRKPLVQPFPSWTGPQGDPHAMWGQWFRDVYTGLEDCRFFEFHDNVWISGGGVQEANAIRGVAKNIVYTGPNITHFQIDATIFNDTPGGQYTYWVLPNSHSESGVVQGYYHTGDMNEVKLTAEFAVGSLDLPSQWIAPYRDRQPYIVAEDYDELAWYCWTPNNPEGKQPFGGYYVPTWDFGPIAVGFQITKTLNFAVSGGGLQPGDTRFTELRRSVQYGYDLFSNRTNDLKIGDWIDGISRDSGVAYPPSTVLRNGDVSVFFHYYDFPGRDWGDAPDPAYPTLLATGGAFHQIVPGFYLGASIDAEADGQPNATASLDDTTGAPDDEDGVVFDSPIIPGGVVKVDVTAAIPGTMNGYLDGWIDFNGDGDWATVGDQIFLAQPVVAGPNVLTFPVPASATANISTYARFRLHTNPGGVAYTGYIPYGEVEDYKVNIYTPVNKGRAKKLPVPSYVLIEKDVVTANFAGNPYYIEEPNRGPSVLGAAGRSAAIGVEPPDGVSSPWLVNQVVTVWGTTFLNGCEVMVKEEGSWLDDDDLEVTPVYQSGLASGGGLFGSQPALVNDVTAGTDAFGLNNVALLMRMGGICRCVETTGGVRSFWIDDGSQLYDGNSCGDPSARGVKVRIPLGYAGPAIEANAYYVVVGIMRTGSGPSSECVRWLWPRTDSDIEVVAPAP